LGSRNPLTCKFPPVNHHFHCSRPVLLTRKQQIESQLPRGAVFSTWSRAAILEVLSRRLNRRHPQISPNKTIQNIPRYAYTRVQWFWPFLRKWKILRQKWISNSNLKNLFTRHFSFLWAILGAVSFTISQKYLGHPKNFLYINSVGIEKCRCFCRISKPSKKFRKKFNKKSFEPKTLTNSGKSQETL
jgi:hypothetical protein